MSLNANGLRAERLRRGITQREMASVAGVSRQSYSAIENGTAVPSTEIALRLGRALNVPVENLFGLPEEQSGLVRADAGTGIDVGSRVRLARVADRLVAFGMRSCADPGAPASGIVERREANEVEVRPLADAPPEPAFVVAGCDPAFGVVAASMWREYGIEALWLPMGSRAALAAVASGEAHVAGTHLRDPESSDYNGYWVRMLVPFTCTTISFAFWEQCLLLPQGNPKGVAGFEDIAELGIRYVNREPGSGSRGLLDETLARTGITRDGIDGYDTSARGHMEVASAIAAGAAGAGIAIRASGDAFGLNAIPLRMERYDLIVPVAYLDLQAVQRFIDTLRRPAVRDQVEAMGGYDVSVMGMPG